MYWPTRYCSFQDDMFWWGQRSTLGRLLMIVSLILDINYYRYSNWINLYIEVSILRATTLNAYYINDRRRKVNWFIDISHWSRTARPVPMVRDMVRDERLCVCNFWADIQSQIKTFFKIYQKCASICLSFWPLI